MKALPLNKFTVAALIWFAAAIYALLFKEGGNSAPPFPHFDKVGSITINLTGQNKV
jgi:hypothetical protein